MIINIEVRTDAFHNMIVGQSNKLKKTKNNRTACMEMARLNGMLQVLKEFFILEKPTKERPYYMLKQKKDIKDTPIVVFGNAIRCN